MPLETDRQKCAHLLRRFGLGASEAELDYYLQDGFNGAIDRLLDYSTVDEGFGIDLTSLASADGKLGVGQVVNWWAARMIMTRRPLQEKMTLFWHDHFATSGSKVGSAALMSGQNETLRRNATGNFRALLREASKDPAMILWLDNQQNVKGHANENFAREVMELFTLGIGHYSEKDVQEGARAFTGWSIQRIPNGMKGEAEFRFRPRLHDAGLKTYLGENGDLDGDKILDILCDNPRTSEFITWKLWRWFAYEDPEPAVVDRHATVFRGSGLDIKTLLKSIMSSSEFYSEKAERREFKNPVDFCISTLRQLGVGQQMSTALSKAPAGQFPRTVMTPAGAAQQTMKGMGMWLLYPPDVSGWAPGQGWITSATMVERIAWGDRLFLPNVRYSVRYNPYTLFQSDPSPAGVVSRLASIFDAPLKEEHKTVLMGAARKASGGVVTTANANTTAAAVARLIFATPEFQFC
jgi:uncharacterized protein (DUF1800 family)